MACDVVIVNHGSAEDTRNAVKSVRHQLRPLLGRVIVVENGTGEAERFDDLDVEVVDLAENVGFAAAVNEGLKRSIRHRRPPRHVMLLNPDAYLLDGPWIRFFTWLAPPVAAAGPRVLSLDGRVQSSIYAEPRPSRIALEALGVQRMMGRFGLARPMPTERREVETLQGSCLVVSLKAWKEVGPFDEAFFLYHEETEWCLRARDHGFINIYDPTVAVVHAGGTEVPAGREELYYRSALRLVARRRGDPAAARLKRWLVPAARCGAIVASDPARRRGLRQLAAGL